MATNTSKLVVDIQAKDQASHVVKGLQSTIIRFVGAVSAALASFSAVVLPARQATEFDLALTNVAKTTGFAAVEMDSLKDSILEMAKTLAVGQTELGNIAAIAGQLGLGNEGKAAVVAFTESVARASVTLGVAEEELSSFAAQVLNVFQVDTSNIENVFSLINELSNNSVADARSLLDIMLRVGNTAGLTAQQAGALAATMKDVGVQTEVAGTSAVRAFSNMESKASKFAEVLGVSTAEWIEILEGDALNALKLVLVQLNTMDAVTRTGVMKNLFGEGRQLATFTKLLRDAGSGFEILDSHIQRANESYDEGTSSIEEYNRVSQAFANQFKLLSNAVRGLAIQFGDVLLESIEDTIKKLQEFFNSADAQNVVKSFAESVGNLASSLGDMVEWLVSAREHWESFLKLIKIFIGYKIAAFFIGWSKGLGFVLVQITRMSRAWTTAKRSTDSYINAAYAAVTATNAAAVARGNLAAAAATSSASGPAASNAAAAALGRYNAQIQKMMATNQQRMVQAKVVSKEITAGIAKEQAAIRLGHIERKKQLDLLRQKAAVHRVTTTSMVADQARYQAALKSTSFAQKQSVVGFLNFGKAAGKAATGLKGLLATARVFGSRIAGFILGPIGGTILTTLLIFQEEIGEIWDNIFGGSISDKAALKAAESRKKAEKIAESNIESFQKFLQSYAKSQDIDLTKDLFGGSKGNGIDEYFKNSKKAVEDFGESLKAIAGNKETKVRIGENIIDLESDIINAEVAFDLLNKETEDLKKQLSELPQYSMNFDTLADRIELNEAKMDAFTVSVEANKKKLEEAKKAHLAVQETLVKVTERSEDLINDITATAGKPYAVWLASFNETRQKEIELQELRQKHAEATRKLTKVEDGGTDAQIASATRELTRYTKEIGVAEKQFEELSKVTADYEKQVHKFDIPKIAITKKQDVATTKEMAKAMEELEGAAPTFKEQVLQMDEVLLRATRTIAVNRKLQESFNEFRQPIDDTIKTIKGIYDNMAKSIESARQKMEDFTESIKNNLAVRREDAQAERELNEISKETKKRIDEVRDAYAKKISNARKLGQTDLISKYENERDAAIEAIKAEEDLAKARVKAANLQKKTDLTYETAADSLKDYSAKLDEIRRKEAAGIKGPYTADKEGAKARADDLRELMDLRTAAIDNNKAYQKSIEDISKSTEAGKDGTLLISDEEVQKNVDNAKEIQDGISAVFRDSKDVALDSGEAATTALNAVGKGMSTAISEATKEINALVAVMPEVKEIAKVMGVIWADALKNVKGTFDELDKRFKDADYDVTNAVDLGEGLDEEDTKNLLNSFTNLGIYAQERFAENFGKDLPMKLQNILKIKVTELPEGVGVAIPVKADYTSLSEDIDTQLATYSEEGRGTVAIKPDEDTTGRIQEEISSTEYDIKLKATDIDLSGAKTSGKVPNIGGAINRASGGFVSGPGTGTSDSIRAWLSNGEYVMDAFTTKFFGSGFFSGLQSIAKKGTRGLRIPGLDGLPRFAAGGMVDVQTTSGEVVTLNLNVGDRSYTLGGQRDQVRGLVAAMKSVSR